MGSLWNRSGTIERYADDLRAAGAKAFFYQGGTLTPLVVYRDSGESATHLHPTSADANGRWPDIFIPYVTSYDVRVTTFEGVQLSFSERVPNPNPVEVDVTAPAIQLVQTGMIHAELVNAAKTGYVRLNGKGIGTAGAPGASERDNLDCLPLFRYLWQIPTVKVSSGRGVDPDSDFAANKVITLPDFRGATPIGLDDMGNLAAGLFPDFGFEPPAVTTENPAAGSAIIGASVTGANIWTLNSTNIPQHTHAASITGLDGTHVHTGETDGQSNDHSHDFGTTSDGGHAHGAYIRDPTHFHASDNGSFMATNGTPFSGGSGGGFFTNTNTEVASTGVHVNSDPNPARTAATDDATASVGNHSHTGTTGGYSADHSHTFGTVDGEGAHGHAITVDQFPLVAAQPFNNVCRSLMVTWFIKL